MQLEISSLLSENNHIFEKSKSISDKYYIKACYGAINKPVELPIKLLVTHSNCRKIKRSSKANLHMA